MLTEHEATPLHQYCFSITNQDLLSQCIARSGVANLFQKHRVIIASSLPGTIVTPLERWLGGELKANKIEVNSLRLDFVSATGLLNYALFADPQHQIINKLKQLNGFDSVDDISIE